VCLVSVASIPFLSTLFPTKNSRPIADIFNIYRGKNKKKSSEKAVLIMNTARANAWDTDPGSQLQEAPVRT
jgi:hypothetical protein